MDIDEANRRLKAANAGLAIECRGKRLVLRGTFPPKPGSGKAQPYRQRYSLGVFNNPAGTKRALAEAMRISGELTMGQFNWPLQETTGGDRVGDWISRYEKHWKSQRQTSVKSDDTWRVDYQQPFSKLPQNLNLSTELLVQALEQTKPNTRTRKRFVDAYKRLAQFAGLDISQIVTRRGNYSAKRVKVREIPTEEQIWEWWDSFPEREWRYAYGLAAVYGLRPHEIWRSEREDLMGGGWTVKILVGTKTGKRRVWPIAPDEWVHRLREIGDSLPTIKLDRPNRYIGVNLNRRMAEVGINCKAYSLRHAYAIRGIFQGMDSSIVASWMGHSVTVHTELYHQWLDERHSEKAFELARAQRQVGAAPVE